MTFAVFVVISYTAEHFALCQLDIYPMVLETAHKFFALYRIIQLKHQLNCLEAQTNSVQEEVSMYILVPQIDPSVPQLVVQSRRRPLLGPSPG